MARPKNDGLDKPNQAEMVRSALAELGEDAKPQKIQEYVKTKYNKELSTTLISNYKSMMKKRSGMPPGRRGRPPKGSGAIQIEDLETVRSLVRRLGSENVVRLVDVVK